MRSRRLLAVTLLGLATACGTNRPEWTVYYTAVEEYHHGEPVAVRGAPRWTAHAETSSC